MRLLYAEDERGLYEAVTDILTYHKYIVDVVENGEDALSYARTQHYDGIILDIMMPIMDGLTVLQELRKSGDTTPVLLLTAKGELDDRIAGLDAGADDYLPKPFAMGELLARVRALLRRRETYTPDQLRFGDLTLDQRQATLHCGSQAASMSRLEYQILELMMQDPGTILSTQTILDHVCEGGADTDVNTVWVYISYLRKKLESLQSSVEIRSKRGVGYYLEARP